MLFPLAILLLLAPADGPPVDKPKADAFTPDPGWKALGKDLWFDAKGRRLVIRARVAITDGALEHLLCSRGSKDHESTLITEAPPKLIHTGLILAGGEPGRPVRFDPSYEPPTGPAIAIELRWRDDKGAEKTADARSWIKDLKTGKPLTTDWVFAGSLLLDDPETKKKFYAADDGDLITVANFASSILDLPFRSSANDTDRTWVSNTEVMPPRGTPVTMILTVRPPAKK